MKQSSTSRMFQLAAIPLAIAAGWMLAMQPEASAQQPPATGANEPEVAVKGAVDHYDGEEHAQRPETPAQVEVKKKAHQEIEWVNLGDFRAQGACR